MSSDIKIFNFKKGLPIEFEIKDLADIKKKPHLFSFPKKATFYQLIWIEKGEAILFIDFREILIKAKEAILISINQVYGFNTSSEYEGKMILFTDSFFTHTELDTCFFIHSSDIFNPIHLNHKIHFSLGYIESLLKLLELEIQRPKDTFQINIIQNLLHILLFEAERSITQNKIEYSFIKKKNNGRIFFNEVENNFKDHKQVEYYTRKLVVYEKVLTKEVKILTGKTPKQYIDARIILEAKRLLVNSSLSIKEISFKLGWEEATNFNKFFKKHTQITPLNFRNNKL